MFWSPCVVLSFHDMRDTRLRMRSRHRGKLALVLKSSPACREIDYSRQYVRTFASVWIRESGVRLAEGSRKTWRTASTECEVWSQRVGGFTAVPALIRQLGADPISILTELGLASDALDSPGRRIPYAAMGAMFQEAARRTECAHFGLLCGRAWHLSDLGLVGEVVRNSATFGTALRMLTVHQHLNSEGGLAFLLQHGSVVDIGYAIYHPRVVARNQIYDALMAGGCNFMRELCGADWMPSEVLFPHAKPADIVRFPARWLDHPIRDANAARYRIAEKEAEAAGSGELVQQVYRALRLLLLRGQISGNTVAQMLAMHRRTLNRRLEAHGVTFQSVLDQVRFQVARELLKDTQVAIDDVAAALGYAGVSPFMRSFRRWSGTTPGRWRCTLEKTSAVAS